MPQLKKLTAIVLAILMIFGSVALMASAADADYNVTISTEFLRKQTDGEWVATEKVKAGETVKVRLYIGTDFVTGDGSIALFYDSAFFSDAYTKSLISVNPAYNGISTCTIQSSAANDKIKSSYVSKGYITSDYAADHEALLIGYKYEETAIVGKFDESKWFCEFELTVNPDASGIGYAEISDASVSRVGFKGATDINVGISGETAATATAMSNLEGTVNFEVNGTLSANSYVELYNKFVVVTFDGNEGLFNGKATVTLEGEAGEEITAPVPSKANYELAGWTASGEDTPHDVTVFPNADTTYTAQWEAVTSDENTLAFKTEIFRKEDGEWVKTDRVKRGEDVKARLYIDISYFTTSGDILLFADKDFFTDSYTENATVSAVLNTDSAASSKINSATGTLTKLSSDATEIVRLVNAGYLTQSFVDTHTPFTFGFSNIDSKAKAISGDKWYVEVDLKVADTASGEGDFFVSEDAICNSDDKTAGYTNLPVAPEGGSYKDAVDMWLPEAGVTTTVESNPVTIDSKVIFDANGGILNNDENLLKKEYTGEVGAAFEYAVPVATKAGAEFAGWVDEDGNAIDVPAEFGYEDVTLYASWKTEYTITYKVDGQEDKIDSYEVGEAIEKPADPEAPDGYEFDAWTPSIPDNMPAENLEVKATFKAKEAKAIFDPDGGKFEGDFNGTKEGYTDDPLTAPAVTKDGFVFLGWTPSVPEKMAPGENTYKANWATAAGTKYTVNTYVMDTTGEYPETPSTTQTLYGETGTEVTAAVNEDFDGFGLDKREEYKSQITGTITADGSLVLNVYYAREIYEITFKFNDDKTEDDVKNYYYGSTVVAPEVPVREGYTTDGWQPDIQKVATETATYELTWDVESYDVIYTVDGEEYKTVSFDYNADVTAEAAPEKTGYTFSGWFTTDNFEEGTEFAPTKMPAEDINVYGKFTAKKAPVNFFVNEDDEEPYDTKEIAFDDIIEKPATNPSAGEDKVFIGWYEASDPDTIYTTTLGVMDDEDGKTFYAAFRDLGNASYTIETYVMDTDGSYPVNPTSTKEYNDGTVNALASIEGKVTVDEGFEIDDDYSVTSGYIEDGKDLVLKAYLKRQQFSINTYVDKALDNTYSFIFGQDVEISEPTKEGHYFTGWKNADGESVDVPETMPAEDVELYASFDTLTYPVYYYTKKTDDKAFALDKTIGTDFGDIITTTLDKDAIPEGYVADGPYTDETCTTYFTAGTTMPAESVKLYYILSPEKITYIFNANGGEFSDGEEVKNVEGEYGTMPEVEEPTLEGSTFCGWTNDTDTPNGYVATWEVNKHDVIYLVDGEEFDSEEDVEFGAPVYKAKDAEKEGYNFIGWKDADGKAPADYASMPDNDLVFEAQFEIKTIKVTTDVNGEKTDYFFNYGEPIEIPDPSVPGQDFLGWLPGLPETAPDTDEPIEVTANFDPLITVARYYVKADGDDFKLVDYKTYSVGDAFEKDLANTEAANEFDLTKYTVEGPYADAAFTKAIAVDEMPAAALDLYYKLIPGTVEITFNADGGEFEDGSDEETVETTYNTIPEIEDPVKEGYTFKGWDPEIGAAVEETTYTATWDINKHSVVYKNGAETVEEFNDVEFGKDIPPITGTEPEKTDYVFVGWKDADGKAPEDYESMPDKDLVFEAQYENGALNLVARYYAKADGEEFKLVDFKTYEEGETIETNLENTEAVSMYDLSRYTVEGPYKDATFTQALDSDVMPGNKLDLYYKLIPGTVEITFNAAGGEFEDGSDEEIVEVTYNTIPEIEDPVKEGYTFKGWDKEIGEAVEETTYTATWDINKNNVVYSYDGKVVEEFDDIDFGDDVPVTGTEPEKPGYVFDGWKDADGKAPEDYDTMPDKELTFEAQWVEEEKDTSFVKLVPLDETSTAMVERDKIVETYNEDVIFNSHSGLSTIAPITEEYGDYTKNPETYFVYGLAQGLTPDDLADYVKVLGDGRMEVECLRSGRLGTGSVIKVYDRKGTEDTADDVLAEQFYVVIFGDVNGDSLATTSDYKAIGDDLAADSRWTAVYKNKAADLNNDTLVTTSDYKKLGDVLTDTWAINQINGLTYKTV